MQALRRYWRQILFAGLLALGAAVVIGAAGISDSARFTRLFPVLMTVSGLTVALLAAVIAVVAARMIRRWRERSYGSRMTAKLAVAAGLTGVLPCLLIYLVSQQFIGRSIDSWFDVRVERALQAGVTLSGKLIAREQAQLQTLAASLAERLGRTPGRDVGPVLDQMRRSADAMSLAIFDDEGRLATVSGPDGDDPLDFPGPEQLAQSLAMGAQAQLEGEGDAPGAMRIRAVVPIAAGGLAAGRYLQITVRVPAETAQAASDLVDGYRDYQELVLTRSALRGIYGVTLALAVLVAVLAALATALAIARGVVAPILHLAQGTKSAASGDLRPIKAFEGDNELNALTHSFNSMLTQIAEARDSVERQRMAAERAHAYLARVLGNLSSGVLVLDGGMNVLLSNTGAAAILGCSVPGGGSPLAAHAPALAKELALAVSVAGGDEIRIEVELEASGGKARPVVFVRASKLTLDGVACWVVVFDDMSAVIDAQRAVAWGEVARRLAHEIKNPLTPIRLAAERLEMKLEGKLQGRDADLLSRACRTIVDQVEAMKSMVNDFRDYARLPKANLAPVDLNELLSSLGDFYATAGTRIDLALEPVPRIEGDATQLRQLVHNLVGNAVDATAGRADALVRVATSAAGRDAEGAPVAVRMVIEDNGPGFPQDILARAFEPYVTTKPQGTGLGLPMVKKIADEHRARIAVANRAGAAGEVLGAEVSIVFPVAR
ncbi:MAG: HAMP domain-containing protein [Duodenibacillus sp.]|nr:HAMP domain-containing protein [Duodenibacillus sp.]